MLDWVPHEEDSVCRSPVSSPLSSAFEVTGEVGRALGEELDESASFFSAHSHHTFRIREAFGYLPPS